jgi:hypothetical protein
MYDILEDFEKLLPTLLEHYSVKDILATLVDAINDKAIALDEEEHDLFTRLDWEQDQINKIIPFIED